MFVAFFFLVLACLRLFHCTKGFRCLAVGTNVPKGFQLSV
jgi:hypothetical protein